MLKNKLLWSITTAEQEHTTYLFGTMHSRDKQVFTLVEQLYPLIDQSHYFGAEYNLDELQEKSLSNQNNFSLPNGQRLQEYYGKKRYEKLRGILLKAFKLNLDNIPQMRPFVVFNMIAEVVLSQDMQQALDFHLWLYAKRKERVCVGIETYEEQLSVLQHPELIKIEGKMLRDIAKNVSLYRKKLFHLTHLYEKQEINLLYQLSKKSLGKLKRPLVYERNHRMANRILAYHRQQSGFFCVGAAHLAGEQGVLRLLKSLGAKVR